MMVPLVELATMSPSGEGLSFWLVVLALLAVLPFLLTIITPFAKFVIVLGLIRQALGTQQVPPNTVITGLALILTIHALSPVVGEALTRLEASAPEVVVSTEGKAVEAAGPTTIMRVVDAVEPPMTSFLERHASPRYIALFESLSERLEQQNSDGEAAQHPTPEQAAALLGNTVAPEVLERGARTFTILAPAFILTELTEAFQIGFLIFVPFLIVDLLVSNVLLAMGMHMMSPVTISLPLKLLLFVLVAGWELVLQGLVIGYT